MIGEIRQNFTEASVSVGLILATALLKRDFEEFRKFSGILFQILARIIENESLF